jgi:hypothetical protein
MWGYFLKRRNAMLTLEQAWQWVQIGFCAGIGASVTLAAVIAGLSGRREPDDNNGEAPHCSKCCPNDDDNNDDLP